MTGAQNEFHKAFSNVSQHSFEWIKDRGNGKQCMVNNVCRTGQILYRPAMLLCLYEYDLHGTVTLG